MKNINPFRLEILNLNYWEHFKASQDANRALGADNPKAIKLEQAKNKALIELNKFKNNLEV